MIVALPMATQNMRFICQSYAGIKHQCLQVP
uniref:Uncharacterized protein n=1 Tax=Rhizophora mucronata TaxID=61149 RepID=A0A2P2PDZ8_RHIMU